MDHTIPCTTSNCLIAGNSCTNLPVSLCSGLGTGRVQVWGEDPSSPIFEGDLGRQSGAVSSVDCLNVRGVLPRIGAGDSRGNVGLFQVKADAFERLSLRRLHDVGVTCVSMNKFCSPLMISVSEDGKSVVSDIQSLGVVNETVEKDNSCLNSVLFWNQNTAALGGQSPSGPLRVWDVRDKSSVPVRNISNPAANAPSGMSLVSLTSHPSLPYQIVSGDSDGGISLWDLRNQSIVCRIESHSSAVRCLVSHPDKPDFIISASDDGSIISHDVSRPERQAGFLSSSDGMGCISMDICSDEVNGPLILVGTMDESVSVQELYPFLRGGNQS